ncbi:hypothetical protein GCM10009038_35640 [Salinicola rhizosphaerae]|uniref:Uncharacterized protein n=1 Tax=Salinicola rhizosphaerae TaxID=1443141 RepID=A0ABQ3ECC3_9GAMM|nr:hypothetical protein GCM10009038_35640 [Salinicola rhizosphaerae]
MTAAKSSATDAWMDAALGCMVGLSQIRMGLRGPLDVGHERRAATGRGDVESYARWHPKVRQAAWRGFLGLPANESAARGTLQ